MYRVIEETIAEVKASWTSSNGGLTWAAGDFIRFLEWVNQTPPETLREVIEEEWDSLESYEAEAIASALEEVA